MNNSNTTTDLTDLPNRSGIDHEKPGYKQTKLGWIPEDWEVNTFGDIVEFKNGLNFSKDERRKGIKIIGVGDFKDYHTIAYENLEEVYPKKTISDEYYLKENDLLFVRSNGNKELVGRVLFILGVNQKITFSGFTIRARIINNQAWPWFYSYLFRSHIIKSQYLKLGGGTNISNLSQVTLSSLFIVCPPLPEQKAIAQCLTTWDKGITTLRQLIAKKEQQKKGLMQQLLTGKKRLPGFSEEWKEYSYGQLVKEIKRPVDWDDNNLYELVSVRRRSGGLFFRESLYGHQIKTKNLKITLTGDFLISKMQIVHGASGLTTKEYNQMHISGSYISIIVKDNELLDVNFLNWYSKTPDFYHQCYISSYGVHIEKMTFDFRLFLKEKITLPPIKEQIAIAQVLQTADRELDVLRQKLEQLQTQKKGLMQQLLTGKKRLPVPKT